jgi:hypothetical protein
MSGVLTGVTTVPATDGTTAGAVLDMLPVSLVDGRIASRFNSDSGAKQASGNASKPPTRSLWQVSALDGVTYANATIIPANRHLTNSRLIEISVR